MVTKSNKLQLQEKRRLEELLKCERDHKRTKILTVLGEKRETIEKPFNDKIKALEEQKEAAVKKAGYGKIYERGCYDTHPELDAFDAETNKMLVQLWERAE